MDNKKNIILIGMMGCGKSTIAHLLDEKLSDFQYVDLDREIEKEADKHIPEIFAEQGEEFFRNLESKLLKKFCAYHNQVIAMGGGIVEREENISLMKESGVVIYLKANVKTLYERIKKSTTRPMLFHKNPFDRMKELMKRREPYYEKAHITVDTEGKELLEIVEEIIEQYEKNR